ncbi:SHOCT domain-containing protein [Embleya sp. NPDC008237]|uniref:SHOCT domain-containing protein n=1 Tax=Embleya sp. NPDC008237 TaxID=3363978 RepID=UPI0036F160B3
MDWGDLVDIVFDSAGDRTQAQQAGQAAVDTAVPGEEPLAVTSGRARDQWTGGTLVLTTHRLLYVKEGKAPQAVPLAGVTDVAVSSSRLTGRILKVTALTGAYGWEEVKDAEAFADKVRGAVAGGPPAPAAAPGAGREATALVEELERLAALHRSGALSDDEFARAKQRMIGA